ncbi:TRAP transporter substrate-binding protein [Bacillus sp. B15-48]|uniref:TRAP transporter substrate-binding protein n=1 Tax=Bacillus sp. B15-48 TaxID=1548601 RepID=UPI00193EEDB8|nr:TRAP transporter substrate-binding protein [Bacillus sp. B15-48]
MRKLKFVFCVLVIVVLAACGNNTTSTQTTDESNSTDSAGQQEYVLKLAHAYSTSAFQHQYIEWFNDEVQKRSDGRLSIDIYPSAQLMPQEQEVPAVLQGQIDMSFTSSPVMASFDPIWNIYELPFVFEYHPEDLSIIMENRKAFDKSENGGGKIAKMMEEKGLKILAFAYTEAYGGIATTELDNLITVPESAKGLKLRTAGGMLGSETIKAIGASSVTITTAEIITALQQKLVDGLLTTPIYPSQVKMPIKTYTNVPLINSLIPLSISVEKFESLPEDLQQILTETGEDLEEYIVEKVLSETNKAFANLESQGVEIYYPTEEEVAEWKEATKPVKEVFIKQVDGGAELFEALK